MTLPIFITASITYVEYQEAEDLRIVASTNFVTFSKLAAVRQASKMSPSPISSGATSRMPRQAASTSSKFHGRMATAFPKAASASSRSLPPGVSKWSAPDFHKAWLSCQKSQEYALERDHATVSMSPRVTPAHLSPRMSINEK